MIEYDRHLRICAYCKGTAELVKVSSKFCVGCTNCPTTLGLVVSMVNGKPIVTGAYDSPGEAIAHWNKRADNDDLIDEIVGQVKSRIAEKQQSKEELKHRWGAWAGFIRELDAQMSELQMFAQRLERFKTK